MNDRASSHFEPYRALLCTQGFEGYRETEVVVIGETAKKFRIKAIIGTKLGIRRVVNGSTVILEVPCRWLNPGETACVPKRAIKRMETGG